MSSLIANTLTVGVTGNDTFPIEPAPPVPGTLITVIPAGAVVLLGAPSASALGATLAANVPVQLPAGKYWLRAPTGTVAVSYYYTSN